MLFTLAWGPHKRLQLKGLAVVLSKIKQVQATHKVAIKNPNQVLGATWPLGGGAPGEVHALGNQVLIHPANQDSETAAADLFPIPIIKFESTGVKAWTRNSIRANNQ